MRLFKLERETQTKRQQQTFMNLLDHNPPDHNPPDYNPPDPSRENPISFLSPSDNHYMTAMDKVHRSPPSSPHSPTDHLFETSAGSVLLRQCRPRENMASKMQQRDGTVDDSPLVHIHPEKSPSCKDSLATDLTGKCH